MHLEKLPDAKPGEKTIIFLRRFWFVPAGIIILLIFLLVIPVAIYYMLDWQAAWVLAHPVATPLLGLLASLFYLAIWVYSFSEFIDYYLDVWIVTNERIINIEQLGLFSRIASELNLADVQDVTSEVHGIVQTVFDYGDVHIQTAAETTRFVFKQVRGPELIKRRVVQLADQARAHEQKMVAGSAVHK